MGRTNNYLIQAAQARERFLSYDQEKLIAKLNLKQDADYLYVRLFSTDYRIDRKNGDLFRREGDAWQDANTFEESLTLLDLVCDSREDRFLSGQWKNMQSFGLQFHQNLLEDERNPLAESIQAAPEKFCAACEAMGGTRLKTADISYSIEVFDGLPVALFFWEGDDEFAPRLRYFWDSNANMYIRYETMYYAKNLLEGRLLEKMQ